MTTPTRIKTPSDLAQEWLALGSEGLILDTETTGLDDLAQIVEIAIVDMTGQPVLNTLVKPTCQIPDEASAIHGISNDDVADAPTWIQVFDQFKSLVSGRRVVIYNADYDVRLVYQTSLASGIADGDLHASLGRSAECAMLAYAEHFGDWNEYRQQWRWQKLVNAASQCGIAPVGAHRALADCLMTLGVIKAMAAEVAHA
ncbi:MULTISPECIES: 3'-5' exonuclease [Pseudomonas]|uniref:3'-5' exonuclease n=1 Tax=Pseudomonas TaxID=286 RepID=UPI0021F21F7C|nr:MULTISPECIES: 3'-5' exonuclease [Pseudomonas]MCV6429399.1 3'-5' exonuclease [Pseudomonas aeruginosa]MCV6437369.1 3'-5' exonuclease [Pseudomonas aeruginosa]MCW5273894.1 3'-5' exonuclease [Pseudomonas aeruginosa]MDU4251422.1 3'-5' exonuclease [Pseudomonas sp.]